MQPVKKCLPGSALKWIACVTMLIDHAAACLLLRGYLKLHPLTPQIKVIYYVLRGIGRLAFPIYVFLLVEGFLHTRSRVKYAVRLFVFAVLSEIPFDIARGSFWDPKHQNVFCTLFLGFMVMLLIDRITDGELCHAPAVKRILCAAAAAALSAAAWRMHTDYGAYGVALITVYYVLYAKPAVRDTAAAVILVFMDLLEACAVVDFLLFRMYNGGAGKAAEVFLLYFLSGAPADPGGDPVSHDGHRNCASLVEKRPGRRRVFE